MCRSLACPWLLNKMAAEREVLVRPAEPGDLLQCVHILNYWVLESDWVLIEHPLSLTDMVELYRKITSKGLPFMVAVWPDQQQHVLGFIYAIPEGYRLLRIPGVMCNVLFVKQGVKGLRLFERLLFPYLKVLLSYPWFRGTMSDTNAGNTHIQHKHSPGYMIGKMPPIVLNGALYKRGQWHNQGLEFFPRQLFQVAVENYEELTHVKV